MASKRPSYPSIRARQRNILEGIGTGDLKYNQAAQRLGVTPTELRKFLDTKSPIVRRNFNRSPAYRKLYAEGERSKTREALGLKRIRRYEFKRSAVDRPQAMQKYPNSKQIGALIQRYYYKNGIEKIEWAAWTAEHNLPTSMDAIKQMRAEGKITESEYRSAVKSWRDHYHGITDSWAARYEDWDDVDDYFDSEGEE